MLVGAAGGRVRVCFRGVFGRSLYISKEPMLSLGGSGAAVGSRSFISHGWMEFLLDNIICVFGDGSGSGSGSSSNNNSPQQLSTPALSACGV